jgi:hypothetical protein
MSYISNKAASYQLTINGNDYTSNLVTWQVSDSSANQGGFAVTSGTLVLANLDGAGPYEDYDRNEFKRGTVCTLDVSIAGQALQRHPRGYFYVLNTSYDPEQAVLAVEIGCRIALSILTDSYDELLALAPLDLDVVQQTIQGIRGSFIAAGKVLYQDNLGVLQVVNLFGTDSDSGVEAGVWVSVLGRTAESVKPLAASKSIPDDINIGYSYSTNASDSASNIDTVVTDSYYWTTYPATIYERQRPTDGFTGSGGITEWAPSTGTSNSCGNTPAPPTGSTAPTSCNEGYSLVSSPQLLAAHRQETSTTEYKGPAGQVSTVITQVIGPALEANSQYYADEFAFCRSTYSTACNPNGFCPMNGTEEIILSKSIAVNYYGEANELVKTITDQYQTELAGAQPFDWRAGTVNGAPQNFTAINNKKLYRVSRTENVVYAENNSSVQETTVYNSPTTRQSGIKKGPIDALNGLKNFTRRVSTSSTTQPNSPDTIKSPQTPTKEGNAKIILRRSSYNEAVNAAGPYSVDNNVPVPFLFDNNTDLTNAVNAYAEYLKRCVRGDSYGLQIAERLRSDIATGWYPGMPFRYADPGESLVLAMRMDACTWGVDQDGAAVITDGLWVGVSDGTLVLGDNTVGNPNAGAPTGENQIINETYVNSGEVIFNVDVNMTFQVLMQPSGGGDGVYTPAPSTNHTNEYFTFTVWTTGIIYSPGSLVETTGTGGLPASNNGVLVTQGATVVDADIFT